jgi:hypothetical protein
VHAPFGLLTCPRQVPNTSLAFTWRWALVVGWLAVYNCQLVDEANRLIRLDALSSCTSFGLPQCFARNSNVSTHFIPNTTVLLSLTITRHAAELLMRVCHHEGSVASKQSHVFASIWTLVFCIIAEHQAMNYYVMMCVLIIRVNAVISSHCLSLLPLAFHTVLSRSSFLSRFVLFEDLLSCCNLP